MQIVIADVRVLWKKGMQELHSEFKTLSKLNKELGDIGAQVLEGLLNKSYKELSNLLDKVLQLKGEMGDTSIKQEKTKKGNEIGLF